MNIGGSQGRIEATGRGVKVVCDESLRYLKMPVEGCRVIIQGFGNVGSNAARLMQERGYSIVGIAERDGGLYNPAGIDIHQLLEYKYRNNTILGFRGAEATPSEELLVTECEILIPAATENVITSRNAEQDQGAHRRGGRERPYDRRGRRDPGRETRLHRARHSGQRRRRDGQLL